MNMRYFFLIIISFLCGITIGCSKPNDLEFYKESISRGNIIVAALERYRGKNKTYPDSLENLVPEYIENLPKSDINDLPFIYNYYEKTGTYSLGMIVEPSGVMLLGAKAIKQLTYNSTQRYQESQSTKIHFTFDGWALQTLSRKNGKQ
jgi:hypothetical protein